MMSESKTKENEKEKVWFAEVVKQPLRLVCCVPLIPVLEIWEHHAISPTMILASMTSWTSTHQFKVAPVLCLPRRKASYE